MKKVKYLAFAIVAASVLALIASLAFKATVNASTEDGQAGITSNPGSDGSQDSPASTPAVVSKPTPVSSPSGNGDQDNSPSVSSNPSSNPSQDGPAGITSNPGTDASQDSGSGNNGGTPPGGNGNTPGGGGSPVVQTGGGGGGGGSSSSSGSFVGGGSSYVPLATTTTFVNASSCPLLNNGIMKIGRDNNSANVSKLQAFLKQTQNADVDVNGIYDQKTVDAVSAFQRKYLTEVMGPWDATRPSGVVYITTVKKINELACAQPLTLNDQELAVINSYSQNELAAANSANGGASVAISTTTNPAGPNLVSDNSSQTAAAGNQNIFQRIWSFIVGLFK